MFDNAWIQLQLLGLWQWVVEGRGANDISWGETRGAVTANNAQGSSTTSTCPVQNVDSAEVETFLAMAKISFLIYFLDFPDGSVVKNLPASAGDAGDLGLIPGSGRSPGVGNGNPLQYSCLGNHMDRGAWQAAVHRVTKESDTTEPLSTYIYFLPLGFDPFLG